MNPNTLADELARQPFAPFRLHLSDGRVVEVRDPEVAVIANLALYLFRVRREQRYIADDTQVISLRHIVSFEPIAPLKNRRRPNRSKRSK